VSPSPRLLIAIATTHEPRYVHAVGLPPSRMTNTFFKSFVSSIQTATAAYFSPKPPPKAEQAPQSFEPPDTPTKMAPDGGKREIYRDVVFYDGSSCLTEEHGRMLIAGGAREYEASGEVEWDGITHLFTENVDFPGRMEAEKNKLLVILTVFPGSEVSG
jgi:hypothetical protein